MKQKVIKIFIKSNQPINKKTIGATAPLENPMNEELEAYQTISYCGDCLIAQRSYNCGSCGNSNKMKDIELTESQFEAWLGKYNLNDLDPLYC